MGVGRRQEIGSGNSLVDMLVAALLAARLVFITVWFDLYRSTPGSMLDIRDGGFTLWAGLLAASGEALWRGWRRPALRQPLLWGLMAGVLAWAALFGVIGTLDKASRPGLPTVTLTTLTGSPIDLASMASRWWSICGPVGAPLAVAKCPYSQRHSSMKHKLHLSLPTRAKTISPWCAT